MKKHLFIPVALLFFAQHPYAQSTIRTEAPSIAVGTTSHDLFLEHLGNPVTIGLRNGSVPTPGGVFQLNTNGELQLIQRFNNSLELHTNSTERMRLLGDGRVGIGTSAPGQQLSVNADPTWVDPRAPGDCQIVVEHRFAGSGYEILGFNYNESAHGPGIGNFFETTDFCTVPLNVQQCQNMRPVVAYTPCDRYIVQWQYQGPCLTGLPQNHSHILVKKMDDAGNIVSTDYEVSNFDLTTQAEVPSVCGRFVTSSTSFSSTHLNQYYQRMMVKGAGTSCMDSTSMLGVEIDSESSASTDVIVYPNPAHEMAIMETASPYENYEICDMSGKQMLSGEIQKGKALVDVSDLNSGTYIVRFISTSNVEHQKLIIH